jgi:hypothetical protein
MRCTCFFDNMPAVLGECYFRPTIAISRVCERQKSKSVSFARVLQLQNSHMLHTVIIAEHIIPELYPHEVAWYFFNFFSIVSSKNNLAKLFPIVFLIVKLAKSKNNLKVSISQKQSKNN